MPYEVIPPPFGCRIRHLSRPRLAAILVAACLGIASATAVAAPRAQEALTDQQISRAVDGRLLDDAGLFKNKIVARVSEGIVTLTGEANSLLSKERAAKIVQILRGVRGVVNLVAVKPSARSDDLIRKDVESAMLYDASTHLYALTPAVKDGVVTLTGTVSSYHERQLAMHVAKGVQGVKEVKDGLVVTIKNERPDAEIAAGVNRAISIDAWLDKNSITTAVKDGVVTLTGAVGSSAQYDRATQLAWTAGVKSVNAQGLNIDPSANTPGQRATLATRSDSEIKQAVRDAFVADPRVFSRNPEIEVRRGVVTLTGVVDNLKAKRAAEQDAKNTVGVWRVEDLLKARPVNPISDEQIARNVSAAFLRDPYVDSYQISVKADRGVVTLTGTVDSYYEKAQAEDVASRGLGVVDVKNRLAVSYPARLHYDLSYDPYWGHPPLYSYLDPLRLFHKFTWPSARDTKLKQQIESQLYWSPWVDLEDITVSVTNGVATLTGTASSRFESDMATANAYEGGAVQVKNNLTYPFKTSRR